MPASLRVRRKSSRPYERRSPTASPAQLEPSNRSLLLQSPLWSTAPVSASEALEAESEPAELERCEREDEDEAEEEDPPDRPGLPTYAEYKRIEAGYLHSLSPRKRDKALITQAMLDKIWDVLHQPDACTIETPQFRFWVRKMFVLGRPPVVGGRRWGWRRAVSGARDGDANDDDTEDAVHADSDSDADADRDMDDELERAMGIHADPAIDLSAVVLHENRPVAIREQLYALFCYCHARAEHGGRDKTCAVIRQHYSWVPKELTAQFVKACPTCASKRGGQGQGQGRGQVVAVADVGAVPRPSGQRAPRRGKGTRVKKEVEVEAEVKPSSQGDGDPLDDRSCEARERAERAWLREREHARTSEPTPGKLSVPVDAAPFAFPGSRSLRLRSAAGDDGPASPGSGEDGRSLPSLATALSNESLDDNVNLSALGTGAGDPLPPVLRPLRLLGPVTAHGPDAGPPDHPSRLAMTASPSLFHIDPVLLHCSYPGLGMSEFESSLCVRADPMDGNAGVLESTMVSCSATIPLLLSAEPRWDPMLEIMYSDGYDMDGVLPF